MEFQKAYRLTATPSNPAKLIQGRIVRQRGISLLEYLADQVTERVNGFSQRLNGGMK